MRIISKRRLMLSVILFLMILVLAFAMFPNKIESEEYIETEKQVELIQEEIYPVTEEEVLQEDTKDKIPEYDIDLSKELQEYTYKLCKEHDISYELILSVLYSESSFNPEAVHVNKNKTRDLGISQFNEKYLDYHAELLGYEKIDPLDPKQSIEVMVKLLVYYREYWKEHGIDSEEQMFPIVLNSYNLGITATKQYVRKYGTISRSYDRNVLERKMQLEQNGKFE